MKQFKSARFAILCLLTALFIAACGHHGGGGGTQQSSDSAFASGVEIGPITGFGSVIVNGTEFQAKDVVQNRIKLPFDNFTSAAIQPGVKPEGMLRTGMIVRVKWSRDAAGHKVYENIEFRPDLRGPIDDTAAFPATGSTFKVMGRTVQFDTATTFDSIRDLADLKSEVEVQLRRPELEISGTVDDSGVLHATRIARKAQDFNGLTTKLVQIGGAITAVPSVSSFNIGGIAVSTTGATFANMTAADIAAGLIVEVKGTLSGTTISNVRIEKKLALAAVQDVDSFRCKGIVTAAGLATDSSFSMLIPLGQVKVTTNSTTQFLKGATVVTAAAVVGAGANLEVEGELQADGSILAAKVAVEVEKMVKLEGNVANAATDVSVANNTIKLNGVTVNVVNAMKIDSSATTAILTMGNIVNNDHLQIVGFLDASGKVIASLVQRTPNSAANFIQGPVTAVSKPNLTLLGISVATDAINTNFRNVDKTLFTAPAQDNFFNAIVVNQTVVKAKFSVGLAAAVEVEIEQQL
jgi:Domain of unknown function (DUF5666)